MHCYDLKYYRYTHSSTHWCLINCNEMLIKEIQGVFSCIFVWFLKYFKEY